ncbi:hypothetical protein N0V95_008008 [Ascochyta clinopodiicola]|nr:hypothetical protein N0V95_008008 [Ascochyta clinopodiicola]
MSEDTTNIMTANAQPTSSGIGILDMPNEILCEIFITIDGEFSKTLWSLSLTCKHFRNVVEEHCEPEYNLRGKWIDDPYAMMERLRDQPRLKHLVRVIRVDYNFATHTNYTEEDVDELVTSLGLDSFDAGMIQCWGEILSCDNGGPVWLALLLPKVETIELSTLTDSSRHCWVPIIDVLHDPADGNFLCSHGFHKLRNLTLFYPPWHSRIAHSQLNYQSSSIGVLELPSLKTLKLDNIMLNEEGSRETFKGLSSVTELRVQMFQEDFMWAGYHEEMDTFHGLKSLHVRIQHPYILCTSDGHERPRYVEHLASQAHSLEDLQLASNEQYCLKDGTFVEMSSHCLAQPNLQHFQNLKSLALTDMSLVGMSTSGPAHWHQSIEDTLEHLAGMFPPSLETFTHLVWDGPSVFAEACSDEHQEIHSWKSIWKASTKDDFPSLKAVKTQKYGLDGLIGEREIIWQKEH